MSTKNLARTVIEGGRSRGNARMRWSSNAEHRAGERQALSQLALAFELDDLVVRPRRVVGAWFADKLGPAERWLRAQSGRPWGAVRGELFTRFDIRTTAGRHIVFCHVLPWVEDRGRGRRWRFHVDGHGVLCASPRGARRLPRVHLPRPERELVRWLAGRRIGARGSVLFWFELLPSGWYRQGRRLAAADAALWRVLPSSFTRHHDVFQAPPAERRV
jgi:hypothetical protein